MKPARPARAVKIKGAGPGWPWSPVTSLEDADIFALQAIAAGNASSGQQQRALAFIRDKICEAERLSFLPGGEDGRRATDFAEGKRFVAVPIRRCLRMPDRGEFARRAAGDAVRGHELILNQR